MIKDWFQKLVDTQRLVRDVDDTEDWHDYLYDIPCHIQTWSEGTTGYEGALFPTHTMWCDVGTDIIEGDRIISGSKTYEVLIFEELDFGENPHLQLWLSLLKL